MMQKISVIVPIFNASKSIKKCIESIINQTYKNIEIILINDGSEDNTLEIINDYKEKDERIKVINKANSGVANTRNVGIEIATGQYIMFVDSDDYIDVNYIYEMHNELVKNDSDVAVSGMTSCENNEKKIKKIIYKNESCNLQFSEIISEIINKLTFCSACKTLIKKELLTNNKIRFDENLKYCEDMIFSFNMLKKATKIRYVNSTGYYYVFSKNSATNKTDIKSINKYCQDNYYAFNYIKNNTQCENYLISNRVLTKINIAIKKVIYSDKITYKLFKNEATKIYNKYLVETGIEKSFNVSEINYETKFNLILIKLLLKRNYFIYYLLLKIKKIIKN